MRNFEFKPETEAALIRATKLMGFDSLWPEQDQAIRANIAGKDSLAILPTAGGKTACFVIPGLVQKRQTVVVAPLKALQYDQVQALRTRGILAYAYNGDLSDEEKEELAANLRAAKRQKIPSFLYTAPESLLTKQFLEFFGPGHFDAIAIDEIHCTSTWGNSFRPDYMRIKAAAARLKIPLCAGFTATVIPDILDDIFHYTPLCKETCVIIRGKFVRDNISLNVIRTDKYEGSPKEKGTKQRLAILSLLKQTPGTAILYGSSRRACEKLYDHVGFRGKAMRNQYTPYLYHAGIYHEDKATALQGFTQDQQPLMICTNAFGMGIDKPDVRQVMHINNPLSLLDFTQEIGRSGRDGKDSVCTTFFNPKLVDHSIKHKKFLTPTLGTIENVHAHIVKTYQQGSEKVKKGFTTAKYLRSLDAMMSRTKSRSKSDTYLSRVRTSVSLLKKSGIIREKEGEGIKLFKFVPGSKPHKELIESSEMGFRAQTKQLKTVSEFFMNPNPTQLELERLLG